jgi:hypothetical protein
VGAEIDFIDAVRSGLEFVGKIAEEEKKLGRKMSGKEIRAWRDLIAKNKLDAAKSEIFSE